MPIKILWIPKKPLSKKLEHQPGKETPAVPCSGAVDNASASHLQNKQGDFVGKDLLTGKSACTATETASLPHGW